MKRRKGFAIVVIIFFAFVLAIIMFTLFRSNTNLSTQTKKTMYQMQAFYLAQSGLQLAKLHIYLLPKEIFNYYGNNPESDDSRNALSKCESRLYYPLDMYGERVNFKYDLYDNQNSKDDDFPYEGNFVVNKLKYLLSDDNMKMTQDSYRIEIEATVKLGKQKEFTDQLQENFIVSRFTGR